MRLFARAPFRLHLPPRLKMPIIVGFLHQLGKLAYLNLKGPDYDSTSWTLFSLNLRLAPFLHPEVQPQGRAHLGVEQVKILWAQSNVPCQPRHALQSPPQKKNMTPQAVARALRPCA